MDRHRLSEDFIVDLLEPYGRIALAAPRGLLWHERLVPADEILLLLRGKFHHAPRRVRMQGGEDAAVHPEVGMPMCARSTTPS